MTLPHLILWITVLGVALPCAFRNATSGALAAAYLFVEGLAYLGHPLPLKYFMLPDIAVLAVIMAKPERYPCPGYRGILHQLTCLLTERSWADRFIICSYPFIWLTYGAAIDELTRYWALWGWAMVQYLAAGGEAFHDHYRSRDADPVLPPFDGGLMLVAFRRGAGVG